MTLRLQGNQLTGFRRGWQAADPYRCRHVHRVWNQIVLDEATKVPLVVVPNVGMQPRCALLHQIGSQGDALYGDRFEQMANRWECVTGADCSEDVVAFKGAQVRLDGFSERPCQVDFLHNARHGYHPLVFRTGSMPEPSAARIQKQRMDFRKQRPRVPSIRCSIVTAMSAKDLYEFPRTDHAQPTFSCLDLYQNGSDVGDRADSGADFHLIAYMEVHFPTFTGSTPIATTDSGSRR